jgi:hypothetical protein
MANSKFALPTRRVYEDDLSTLGKYPASRYAQPSVIAPGRDRILPDQRNAVGPSKLKNVHTPVGTPGQGKVSKRAAQKRARAR